MKKLFAFALVGVMAIATTTTLTGCPKETPKATTPKTPETPATPAK